MYVCIYLCVWLFVCMCMFAYTHASVYVCFHLQFDYLMFLFTVLIGTANRIRPPPSGPYPVQTIMGNSLIPHISLGLPHTSHPKPPYLSSSNCNPIGRDPSQQPNLQLVNYSSSSDLSEDRPSLRWQR